jgi:hypothetical protein
MDFLCTEIDAEYYNLENKKQLLRHCAMWRSHSVLWQSGLATVAYFRGYTVYVYFLLLWNKRWVFDLVVMVVPFPWGGGGW